MLKGKGKVNGLQETLITNTDSSALIRVVHIKTKIKNFISIHVHVQN